MRRRSPARSGKRYSDVLEGCADDVIGHVGRFVGPVGAVLRRHGAGHPRIDLVWVPPGADRDHHTLVTRGMAALPMRKHKGPCPCNPYVELVLRLPAAWPMGPDEPHDARAVWPLDELEQLAVYPHRNETLLALGHTVTLFDPAVESFTPMDPGGRFYGWILRRPSWAPRPFGRLRRTFEIHVDFLSAVPLHRDELALAFDRGSGELFRRLDAAGVTDVLAPDRPSVLAPVH